MIASRVSELLRANFHKTTVRMTTGDASLIGRVGLVQMCCGDDMRVNIETGERLVREAVRQGAEVRR